MNKIDIALKNGLNESASTYIRKNQADAMGLKSSGFNNYKDKSGNPYHWDEKTKKIIPTKEKDKESVNDELEKLYKTISDKTQENNHTESVLELAKFLKDTKAEQTLGGFLVIEEYWRGSDRYSFHELFKMRDGVRNKLLSSFRGKYGKKEFEKLNSSF